MSAWPSGLRRQTQGFPFSVAEAEISGPLMWAWVRIPLLTVRFYGTITVKYFDKYVSSALCRKIKISKYKNKKLALYDA